MEPVDVTPEQLLGLEWVGNPQPVRVVLPEVRYGILDAITGQRQEG